MRGKPGIERGGGNGRQEKWRKKRRKRREVRSMERRG